MTIPQLPHLSAAILLTQECEAPGCYVVGDQNTIVRCRACGGWFCTDHIDAQESVTLVHPVPRVLKDLAYYQGICLDCRQRR